MFGDGLKQHGHYLVGERLVPAAQREHERARLLQVQAVARLLVDEREALSTATDVMYGIR